MVKKSNQKAFCKPCMMTMVWWVKFEIMAIFEQHQEESLLLLPALLSNFLTISRGKSTEWKKE